jgi:glycosyltransferase involved in cell wall biosynthesis
VSKKSVVFLAPEPLLEGETGPTRRTVKLAEAVAETCSVTLAAPSPSVFPDGPFRTLETGPVHDQHLNAVLGGHDVAVIQTLPSPRQLLVARRSAPRLVVDVPAPPPLEASRIGPDGVARDAIARWRMRQLIAHMAAADLVLCGNERQRDLLLGAALATGAMAPGTAAERIPVVPYGIDAVRPRQTRAPLRGAGLLADGDRLAIWAGGMWSWLDPLTALRALERLRPARPDLKLAFVAFEHPDPSQRRAHEAVAAEAIAYVRDRRLEGSVLFRPAWLSRQDYFDHLIEADVGVSLDSPALEGEFASRTRLLDYLVAGLPVVCTAGNTMADVVATRGLGSVVGALDADACAAALDRLTDGEPPPEIDRGALAAFEWRNVARPLVEYCVDPGPARPPSWLATLGLVGRSYPAFLRAVYRTGGAREFARALGRRTGGPRRLG